MKYTKVFAGNGFSIGLTENGVYRWGKMIEGHLSTIPMKIDDVHATDIIHFGSRHFDDIALLLADGRVKLCIGRRFVIFDKDRVLRIFNAEPNYGVYIICKSKIYLFTYIECSELNFCSLEVNDIIFNVILTKEHHIYEFENLHTPVAKEVKSIKKIGRAIVCLLEDGRILYKHREVWEYKHCDYVELLNFHPLAAMTKDGEIHIFDSIDNESASYKITEGFSRILSSDSMIVLIDDLNVTIYSKRGGSIQKKMHKTHSKIVDGSVSDHILLIDENGHAVSHGNNSRGQLGIGTTENVDTQTYVNRRDSRGNIRMVLDDRVTDLFHVSISQDEYKEMEKRVKDLETHIECMPDGRVFLETLEHFNSLKGEK